MSFRRLGKLFKTRKTDDKQESKEITLPAEGFNKSIQMLLAYSGQQEAESGSETREVVVEDVQCSTQLHRVAVLRCLGRSRALAGADPFEDLEIDKIVDVFIDLLNKIQALGVEELDSKAELDELMAVECLAKLDAIVARNRGHLALSKLTWADFLLAGAWGHVRRALRLADDQFANIELLVHQLTAAVAVNQALQRGTVNHVGNSESSASE